MPQKLVLFDFFRTLYYSNHTIPEELLDVIMTLKDTYLLGILSSMATETIFPILEEYGIADYFTEVSGNNKAKSERIKAMIAKYNLKPKDIVLVSDTVNDIHEANAAEVQSIGVTWGIHSKQMLQGGNPFKVVDAPLDIISAVKAALG